MKKKVDYLEYNELKLVELVDVEVLQKIQDAFSEMTGMAAITTDLNGTETVYQIQLTLTD